jgi:hypothetical protein
MGRIAPRERQPSALMRRVTELVAPGSIEEANALREGLRDMQQRLIDAEAELNAERAEAERLRNALRLAQAETKTTHDRPNTSPAATIVAERPMRAPMLAESVHLTERLHGMSDQELADSFTAARDLYTARARRDDPALVQYWTSVADSIVVEASGRPAFGADGASLPEQRRFRRQRGRTERMRLLRDSVQGRHDVGSPRSS